MNIKRNNEVLELVGVLWSSSKEFSKDIMLELALEHKLEQITIYDLGNEYEKFIYECYQHDEAVMSDGYIYEKIDRLLKDSYHQIVAFTIEIQNPTYQYNSKGSKQCLQARTTKDKIRKEFSTKISNYFLDNIMHLSDNKEETELLVEVLNKYNVYAKKSYLRKGSESKYAHQLFEKEYNTYLKVVNSIDIKDEER